MTGILLIFWATEVSFFNQRVGRSIHHCCAALQEFLFDCPCKSCISGKCCATKIAATKKQQRKPACYVKCSTAAKL